MNSLTLSDPITRLRGLGPKTAQAFYRHSVTSLEDLCYFFPRAWIDATKVELIKSLRLDASGLIDVQVVTVRQGMSKKMRRPYLLATVADASGSLEVYWFNAFYLRHKIKPGARFMLYGKLQGGRGRLVFISPRFIASPALIPIYPEISGLASSRIILLINQIKDLMTTFPDYLPTTILAKEKIIPLRQALGQLHFPHDLNDIQTAKDRLAFDELLMLMVPAALNEHERAQEKTTPLIGSQAQVKQWCKTLPFKLTSDQEAVIEEVLADMLETKPMNRLLLGDVGSGKTVVGLAAAYQAVISGKQVVWLAPTELLARQHFETAQFLYGSLSLSIGLWTRTNHFVSQKTLEKATQQAVMDQPLIIGTHALLAESINFKNLGLLIIDEQHRFGVKQRAQLRTFGGKPVHLLSMTATPIPRTMALLLYGDLELSHITTKPVGRKTIVTKVVAETHRDKAYAFIETLLSQGQQAYVVCPVIEPAQSGEGEVLNQLFLAVEEKKSVITWLEHLKRHFPHRRIGLLHGKLKSHEKQTVMEQFRHRKLDMLVTTTVIEVGVDVPNATIMIIENADCFGLAQLHQLRGRVGRDSQQSFCFLFSSKHSSKHHDRLGWMEKTNDGFILAQKDLELRGPGEITGLSQSGVPPLRFATLHNPDTIALVKSIAQTLIGNAEFRTSLERFWRFHHPE